jgi:hypothetical protein
MTLPKEGLFTENELIDPNRVIGYLSLKLQSIDKISSENLIKILKKMLPAKTGIKVTYKKVRSAKDCFGINGYYDSDFVKDIELQVCCSSFKKQFNFPNDLKEQLIYDIADTLCHETIHRRQFYLRGQYAKIDETGDHERDYYLDPDEIFAYSVNIAHNFYRRYGKHALKKLSDFDKAVADDCYLADYYYWFYNDITFKKLMKMIAQNIVAIDSGKICHRSLI